MDAPFTYGNPIIFRTPIWVNLPSDPEVGVLIKPLSYSTLTASSECQYMREQDDAFFKHETIKTLITDAIIKTANAVGFPSISAFVRQLSKQDAIFIYDKLMELSVVSKAQLDALDAMLDIQFNPQFSDDSWDCTNCQAKKLDYSRACGFLPEDKRDPSPALPRIGTRRFSVCPISTMDAYVINKASMCHNMFAEGLLPELGGVGEQTEWFIRTALLYKRKIGEAERLALDNHKKKNK